MNQFLDKIQEDLPAITIKKNGEIAQLTSFKTGGEANMFVAVETTDDLIKIVSSAWKTGVPVRILGSGTNAVIPDQGFDGLIIKNNCRKFDLQGIKGKFTKNTMKFTQAFLYAESGAITNQVVRFVLDQGFGGLEHALGLPGTVGGAVAVNANYPKENVRMGRAVYAAKVLTKDGVIDVENDYLHFGEDTSRLLSERSVLISVLFALHAEDKTKLWERADQAVAYRTGTQPKMLMKGMTFRNMMLTNLYPNSSLPREVSAEFLIEKAGLRGYRVGDVQIWEENPRYFINKGSGTAEEMQKLMTHLKETIFRKFGVQLDVRLHSIT